MIVDGHHADARARPGRTRDERVHRQHELRDAPVVVVVLRRAAAAVGEADVAVDDHQARRLVQPAFLATPGMPSFGGVQERHVRGVDVAFEHLQPVRLDDPHRHAAMRRRARVAHSMSGSSGMLSRAGRGTPRRCRRTRAPDTRRCCTRSRKLLSAGSLGMSTHVAATCRTSSRGRRSAARTPRCGRRTAARGGAGRTPRPGRPRRWCRGRRPGPRPGCAGAPGRHPASGSCSGKRHRQPEAAEQLAHRRARANLGHECVALSAQHARPPGLTSGASR